MCYFPRVVGQCCCVLVVFSMLLCICLFLHAAANGLFLYVIAYVDSSKYLCNFWGSFLHDTFPMLLFKGFFSVLLIMRYFFRVAMYMWFSPYWCFEVLLSMCFLSSCCKIVVFSKLLFVGCVFYVVVKPHHLFLNVFLHF